MESKHTGAGVMFPARMKHRPFLTPIWMSVFGLMLVFAFLGIEAWMWIAADSTTIIVVRHAEKSQEGDDPPLNSAGEARAQRLAGMFGDAQAPGHVDAIYVTAASRNRMTAAPLAASLKLTPIVATGDPSSLARRILREHEGGRVLVVGHADTVPALVASLTGAHSLPAIGADEYGTMYIVTVPRIGRSNFLRLSY